MIEILVSNTSKMAILWEKPGEVESCSSLLMLMMHEEEYDCGNCGNPIF